MLDIFLETRDDLSILVVSKQANRLESAPKCEELCSKLDVLCMFVFMYCI